MLISLFNSYYLIFRAHVRHLVIFIVPNRCWYFVISDVVISASALKTIFNNFMPQLDQTWTVPFVVRRHGDKSVIYFDKTLPPTSMTTEEKTRFRIKRGARIKLAPPWDKIKKSKLNQMKKNAKTFQPEADDGERGIFEESFDHSSLETFGLDESKAENVISQVCFLWDSGNAKMLFWTVTYLSIWVHLPSMITANPKPSCLYSWAKVLCGMVN